jgi:hypothetical protein
MGDMRNAYGTLVRKPEATILLGRYLYMGGIIFKSVLKKWNVRAWCRFSGFRINTSAGFL